MILMKINTHNKIQTIIQTYLSMDCVQQYTRTWQTVHVWNMPVFFPNNFLFNKDFVRHLPPFDSNSVECRCCKLNGSISTRFKWIRWYSFVNFLITHIFFFRIIAGWLCLSCVLKSNPLEKKLLFSPALSLENS